MSCQRNAHSVGLEMSGGVRMLQLTPQITPVVGLPERKKVTLWPLPGEALITQGEEPGHTVRLAPSTGVPGSLGADNSFVQASAADTKMSAHNLRTLFSSASIRVLQASGYSLTPLRHSTARSRPPILCVGVGSTQPLSSQLKVSSQQCTHNASSNKTIEPVLLETKSWTRAVGLGGPLDPATSGHRKTGHAVEIERIAVQHSCRTFRISETCYCHARRRVEADAEVVDWLNRLPTTYRTVGSGCIKPCHQGGCQRRPRQWLLRESACSSQRDWGALLQMSANSRSRPLAASPESKLRHRQRTNSISRRVPRTAKL